MREAVRIVFQELTETEAAEPSGAGLHERSEARTNEQRAQAPPSRRGQHRHPKAPKGQLLPSILEPRRRIDQALYAVVMKAFVHGVSTRAVDELIDAFGIYSGISRSEVSRICMGLDTST